MKNLKFLPTMLSIVFALVCLHVSVSAQTDDKNSIAKVSASGDTIRFDVFVQHAGATLTVAASNGKVYRREFKAGDSPTFAIYDKHGVKLPDGQFTYDLQLAPVLSPEIKKDMVAARAKGDDAVEDTEDRVKTLLPSHPLVQSGAFAVVRGSIVIAGGIESDGRSSASKTSPVQRKLPQTRSLVRPNAYLGQEGAVMMEAVASRPYVGRAFVPGLAHAAFLPDQVIPDDLIVQGSLCVGFDCVNNESFGFDTIRMKENNTRIKFEDTSVGSFPTNDWQLTANDSASGGASKFSIDDVTGAKTPFTVEAGATTNSIFVDSTGRVGFRTSTPVLDLHVNTSNTPALRLEQNSSGGFTSQTWDVAGNEANFFIRDVTGGSKLSFRIRPGAQTSSIDIAANSEVGIMTASPMSTLDVSGNTLTLGSESGTTSRTSSTTKLSRIAVPPFTSTSLSFAALGAATTATDNAVAIGGSAAGFAAATFIIFNTAANTNTDTGTERMRITSAGNVGIGTSAPTDLLSVNGSASKPGGGSWSVFSDERLKNIKGQYTGGLKAVMQLQPLRYEYKPDNALGLKSNGEHIGFGAQQLQKVIPEAVTSTGNGYLVVNNDPIIWTMLNAIKEQQKEIEQLKAQIQQLQPRANRGRGTRNRRR